MQKFAVFGNPIDHSISPKLHNMAILKLNLDAFYGRILLQNGENLKETFLKLGLNAANITLPFKLDAFKICDFLDEAAKNIGSVNTIVLKDKKFHGYNTDALGFYKAILEFGEIKKALILGAGGTTMAMSYILAKNGVKFDILNRSEKSQNFKAENFYTYESFCENFGLNFKNLDKISSQNFKISDYDLIINSTSAGLKDENLPAPKEILDMILPNAKFAFDAIYGKITPFLALAKKHNLKTKDGLEMLVNQAVLAFNLFYDNKFSEAEISKFMHEAENLK